MKKHRHGISDTDPKVDRILTEMIRKLPSWRKVEMVNDLINMSRQFSLSGLRSRHSNESESEIRKRLATILYGQDVADKMFSEPGRRI
jgi:hypothetical protein